LAELSKAIRPQISRIGKSVKGRKLDLWTFNGDLPLTAPVVWLMFRQHAWESGTSWTAEGMLRQLPAGIVWKVLPLCDPDGVALGGVRFNQYGFDLNRNWDSPDDNRLRPEIMFQRAAIEKWLGSGRRIDLFLTLHNTETSEYLEGPSEGIGPKLFASLKANSRFAPTRDYFSRMDWQGKGRANVIQYLWAKHKIPACLMELRVAGADHRNWIRFGPELAKSIAESLG
jgi:murein tripeptide amidase MpaA